MSHTAVSAIKSGKNKSLKNTVFLKNNNTVDTESRISPIFES